MVSLFFSFSDAVNICFDLLTLHSTGVRVFVSLLLTKFVLFVNNNDEVDALNLLKIIYFT